MEYEKRAGHIIDSQDEIGGWPVLAEERRSFILPDNHSADDDSDGYTNIEELLQQMAAEVEGRSCFSCKFIALPPQLNSARNDA